MKVKLLHYAPLTIADAAIGKCYDKGCYTDPEKIQNRINNVANVKKHASTIEHLSYSFDIECSRACLQEIARHRIASYSVKSTRYTLKELRAAKDFDLSDFLIYINDTVTKSNIQCLKDIREALNNGMPNDKAKYMLPEAYKTSLVMTINARSLQNFISLRSSKHALAEIQDLAHGMYSVLPEDHLFLFSSLLND